MATIVPIHGGNTRSDSLDRKSALQKAWVSWIAMLSTPFLFFLFVCWSLMADGGAPRDLHRGQTWFIMSMAYMAIAVPLAFFWRSHYFKAYWRGDVVPPRAYLVGMLTLWITMEIGGLLSLVGCLVSHSLLPNLLPALVAFVLFVPLWPSGRAMTNHGGNADDPERYEEPR